MPPSPNRHPYAAMSLLLPFDDPRATRVDLCGGKGANLALLTQNGFPVPAGMVVTTSAYQEFVSGLGDILALATDLSAEDPVRLQQGSAQLREELARAPLAESVVAQVREALAARPEGQAYSVRSSSNLEDLASAAFAGQHDTFLNVIGPDEVLTKVKACFLSLWHDRAIAYRREHGFDHTLASMAVVIQEMVPCDVAGVAFSINPVNGDLGTMVVDANYGLGESVVSGEAEVDHFELDKATGAVKSRTVATKSHMVVSSDQGTEDRPVDEAAACCACLSDGQLAELATLLGRVERHYRFPQDIEWGLVGDTLHLLQSRPITTIPPKWTRDESAERFPKVITPLTWDFVEAGFHESLHYSFRLMDYPAFRGKWFASFGHYIYGNQNAVRLYAGRAPFHFTTLEDLLGQMPRLREEYRWVQELPVTWMRDLDGYLIRLGVFSMVPLQEMNETALWAHVKEVVAHGATYFRPNIAISITQSVLCRLLLKLLAYVVGEQDARPVFDALMSWCETKTGQINRELFELAHRAQQKPALAILLKEVPSREIIEDHLLAPFEEFAAQFERFLENHGHREIDFDAYQPPWREAPWVVLDNLKIILASPMHAAPVKKEREIKMAAQQAEFRLFSKLPAEAHYFFSEILRLARAYTSLDDLEHYQTTRLNQPLRMGLRALGERLVARGVLEEPMDIFYAHEAQIDTAVSASCGTAWRLLGEQVRTQKAACLADAAREPEWNLGESTPEPVEESGDMTGLAGSPGESEGEVFRVLSADDFAKFPKGAVLVAHTTSPTWTPLFYLASAVITSSGGPLSHGAVTAREMGIPAVMAVRECLSRLSNGQRVRVDGSRGRVRLVQET